MRISEDRLYISMKRSRNAIFISLVLFLLAFVSFTFRWFVRIELRLMVDTLSIASLFTSAIVVLYYYLQLRPFSIETMGYDEERQLTKLKNLRNKIEEIEECLRLYEDSKGKQNISEDYIDIIVDRCESIKYSWTPIELDFEKSLLNSAVGINVFKINLNNLKNEISLLVEKSDTKISEEKSIKQMSYDKTTQVGERIYERLLREIDQLTKRANVYIVIGTIITVIAGVVLYFTVHDIINVYANEGADLKLDNIFKYKNILPLVSRLTLIVFIEVFAFYYLKLYKETMNNIRYYQNEITNVELKMISLNTAYSSEDDSNIKVLINELSKTERNFVLNKNQSTIEIEKTKHEKTVLKDTFESISKILKSAKS